MCRCHSSHLQGIQSRKAKQKKTDILGLQTSTDDETTQERHKALLKKQAIAIGINEVTRLLEKDQLSLILANRSVKPLLLVEHLIPLAVQQHCHAVALNKLSEMIGPLVGVKIVSAIGFKVVSGAYKERRSSLFICSW